MVSNKFFKLWGVIIFGVKCLIVRVFSWIYKCLIWVFILEVIIWIFCMVLLICKYELIK